ncbi:mechanosensitive ion channel domain-containing protein [Aliiroseovarius subalbicans]|uniref:mechanosensitive ion channel domain-containing protein n=1 Tax=Aliiroseovarius subalbicans TaxID=2925840 RepID=UPI001F5A7DA6|nr:mechanosensitive ion channel domain-containing protein [Aliiroseovarius subalbicans]MCI2400808.1 mechanosensitive ion channel [Aliiroseovarius subalbicans]
MSLFRLLALLFCLTLPFSPVQAQDGTITTETGTAQAEVDAAMATRIREIMGELDGFTDVTVMVNEGVVTLRGTTLETTGYDELSDLVGRVNGVVAIQNEVSVSTDITKRLTPAMERFWTRIKQGTAYLPLVMVGFFAFGAVVFAGFLVARMKEPWNTLAPNAFVADIYRVLIRLAFVVAGIVVALDILGATALLSTIMGAAGIIGLALGFAVRDTVENFIASLLLSIRQPFRPNDTIEIAGDVGKVIRLTSRATILLSFDGNHIRIPNATVFKSRIINYTRNRERRFQFTMHLDADANVAVAQDRGLERLAGLPFVLDAPGPSVWIDKVDGGGVTLCFSGWIDQHHSNFDHARGEAMRLVKDALDKPARKGAKPPQARDVSPEPDTDAEKVLTQLAEEDREANKESDLLTADGADE